MIYCDQNMTDLSLVRATQLPAALQLSRPVTSEYPPVTVDRVPHHVTDALVVEFLAGPSTAIVSCNAERRIVSMNSAALRILCADEASLLGLRFSDCVSTADRTRVGHQIWAASKQPSPVPFECSIVAGAGRVFRAEVTVLPLSTSSGTLEGYLLRFTEVEAAPTPTAQGVITLASMSAAQSLQESQLASIEDLHLRMAGAWRASTIKREPISLLRIDVEGLHAAAARLGGRVTSEVTSWISDVMVEMFPRSTSMPARLAYGSFACVLPGGDEVTSQARLDELRERLQLLIEASRAGSMLSVSMGYRTAWPHESPDADYSSLFTLVTAA